MEKAELTALVVRAQSGDQAAMEEVLRAAHTSVSYQCRKLLRDPRDAEDMTQEVLLAVYTKLDMLKTPEAFWGWLNQTTVHRCVSALKRGHVEYQFAEDEQGHSALDNLEELDEQQVPDKALDNAETTRMIEEIVDGLPEVQRVCTLMYYYDEMSVKEIASVLGVSENTLKSRLNYARKAVKERVLDYEKKGVKLYGLSPLPFILFFLLRATGESADGAKAAAVARQVMEAGAAAGAAVVIATRNAEEPEPAVSEAVPDEDEEDETGPVETEETETETPPVEEELIPADRLTLLDDIVYYGDPAQCRMTVNQARAYAEVVDDPPFGIDGQPTTGYEYVWDAWRAQWDEGGQKYIRLYAGREGVSMYFNWAGAYYEAEWTVISIGPELSLGDVDEGYLYTSEFSPGADAAVVLRRCAGD